MYLLNQHGPVFVPSSPWTPEGHILGGVAATAIQHDGRDTDLGTGFSANTAEEVGKTSQTKW